MAEWWRRNSVSALLTTVAALAAGGAFLVGVLAGSASGGTRQALLGLGVLLTAAGIVLAAIERGRSERARRTAEQVAVQAEEDLTLTLNGALAPITSYLGELATASREDPVRQALVGQVRQAVVDAAVKLTAEGARSALYELDPGGTSLGRTVYAGRSTLPRERFVAGTADGDFVLELVNDGDLVFVDDIAVSPLVSPSTEGYSTVIAVAVTAGLQPFGMLTVDAPAPGDLTATDVELVRVLANLLATGLAATGPVQTGVVVRSVDHLVSAWPTKDRVRCEKHPP